MGTFRLSPGTGQRGLPLAGTTPALFNTPMYREGIKRPENRAFAEEVLAKVPMGRVAEVEEFGAMACRLTSDECSFTTASTFDLSGGRATY
ncbi:SDR family oxidoreductase [Spirillospora sp. CA-255316]